MTPRPRCSPAQRRRRSSPNSLTRSWSRAASMCRPRRGGRALLSDARLRGAQRRAPSGDSRGAAHLRRLWSASRSQDHRCARRSSTVCARVGAEQLLAAADDGTTRGLAPMGLLWPPARSPGEGRTGMRSAALSWTTASTAAVGRAPPNLCCNRATGSRTRAPEDSRAAGRLDEPPRSPFLGQVTRRSPGARRRAATRACVRGCAMPACETLRQTPLQTQRGLSRRRAPEKCCPAWFEPRRPQRSCPPGCRQPSMWIMLARRGSWPGTHCEMTGFSDVAQSILPRQRTTTAADLLPDVARSCAMLRQRRLMTQHRSAR